MVYSCKFLARWESRQQCKRTWIQPNVQFIWRELSERSCKSKSSMIASASSRIWMVCCRLSWTDIVGTPLWWAIKRLRQSMSTVPNTELLFLTWSWSFIVTEIAGTRDNFGISRKLRRWAVRAGWQGLVGSRGNMFGMKDYVGLVSQFAFVRRTRFARHL